MADKTLISLVGGGFRPPTGLTFREMTPQNSGTWQWRTSTVAKNVDAIKFGPISGTTYQNVIDITGPGVLTLLGLIRGSSGSVSTPGMRVIIDGVTAMEEDATGTLSSSQEFFAAVGGIWGYGAAGSNLVAMAIFHEAIIFNESLVVDIKSDGDWLEGFYSRYFT